MRAAHPFASTLGHPNRLRALHLLFQGARSIEELATLLNASVANTAAHFEGAPRGAPGRRRASRQTGAHGLVIPWGARAKLNLPLEASLPARTYRFEWEDLSGLKFLSPKFELN